MSKKVKWPRYKPGVAQRVGRGIALLFHDRGTRRGWVVSSTPRPHFTPGKDTVPILQEAGWAPGPVWTGGKPRSHRDSIPDRPVRSQSLYRLSYPAHIIIIIIIIIIIEFLTSQLWLGNIRLSWDVVINRIRLGGHICSLKSFLQLNMCQELQIFAAVYMYWGAG